jgi:exodeoxyribonuclease V alpha subunit
MQEHSEQIFEGRLAAVTWRAPNGSRAIARLRSPEGGFVTVAGPIPELPIGSPLVLRGQWVDHPKYGRQFQADACQEGQMDPNEILVRYLGSGLFFGIGQATAQRIVEQMGARAFEILDADPTAVGRIRGIGADKARRFELDWRGQSGQRPAVLKMMQMHLPISLSLKWARVHGDQALSTLQADPYRLCLDPWNLGFQRCDAIALQMGVARDGASRLRGGLKAALEAAILDGHTCLPGPEWRERTAKLLGAPFGLPDEHEAWDRLEMEIAGLRDEGMIEEDSNFVYLPWLHRAEKDVAQAIQARLMGRTRKIEKSAMDRLSQWEETRGWTLSSEQREAVKKALEDPLFVLTGGPGTGKTSTLQGILQLARDQELKTLLAAPTGRAARRMEEVTGRTAQTLHRLLELQPEDRSFTRNSDKPLDCDVLIVDEVSMVDLPLMAAVLAALPMSASLVLVGDQHQLPSVGPGFVLGDLLGIAEIPRVCLTTVFRQAQENDIPHNAQKILIGELPQPVDRAHTHFHLRPCADPQEAVRKVVDLVCKDLPTHFGCDPLEDIQVLCPVKRGPLGTENLNRMLQKELRGSSGGFRPGDKVMQIRNDYTKDVFNGDIGLVRSTDADGMGLEVDFPDGLTAYEGSEREDLLLAYAITVHKSQGSEYPYVVLVLDPEQGGMLQRRLLYTAVTRAKQRLFVVHRGDALLTAVENSRERPRYGLLQTRLHRRLRPMA